MTSTDFSYGFKLGACATCSGGMVLYGLIKNKPEWCAMGVTLGLTTALASHLASMPTQEPWIDHPLFACHYELYNTPDCQVRLVGGPDDSWQVKEDSTLVRVVKIIKDTGWVSIKNILPWNNTYFDTNEYIHVLPDHLTKPVMIGQDIYKRFYLSMKYVCNQTTEGALTLF